MGVRKYHRYGTASFGFKEDADAAAPPFFELGASWALSQTRLRRTPLLTFIPRPVLRTPLHLPHSHRHACLYSLSLLTSAAIIVLFEFEPIRAERSARFVDAPLLFGVVDFFIVFAHIHWFFRGFRAVAGLWFDYRRLFRISGVVVDGFV